MTEQPLQLYSLATPNGQKISIALEEMGLAYDAHTIDIRTGDQFSDAFIAINPNSKIPALVDPTGDAGKPLPIMESGAILLYLAEKTGKFLPTDPTQRMQTIQWLMWQMAGFGPMLGQFGHFTVYAAQSQTQEALAYGAQRYETEALRLLTVLEKQLEGKSFIIGEELTIADFAIMPWVVCLEQYYNAGDRLKLNSFKNIVRWRDALLARPAIAKGMTVCSLT